MKQPLPFMHACRLKSLLVVLTLLLLACIEKERSQPVPGRPLTCRLTSEKNTQDDLTTLEKWHYDSLGRVVWREYYLDSYSAKPRHDTVQDEYIYDKEGFLMEQKIYTTSPLTKVPVVYTHQFEYKANRLVKATHLDPGPKISSVSTYQYDDAGQLTQYVKQTPQGVSFTYLYKNGKQIDYFDKSPYDNGQRPYLFADGRRSAMINSEGVITTRFYYDAQGQLSRSESFSEGRLDEYSDYEYADGIDPNKLRYYPKGWPEELRYGNNKTGENMSLNKRVTTLRLNAKTGIFYKSADNVGLLTRDSNGLLLERETKRQDYSPSGEYGHLSQSTESYTYEACQ